MKILKKRIELCKECNNYTGYVKEKNNGHVPVLCHCDLEEEKRIYGKWKSPCLISPNGDKLWVIPISDFIDEDGVCRHNPWFGGPNLNHKSDKK